MPKRLYYICDPNLPVATPKRIQLSGRCLHFFDLKDLTYIGQSYGALALSHRGISICVGLEMAKKLSSRNKDYVYVFDTLNIEVSDTEAFCRSIIEMLRDRMEATWYPPAGFERGV